MLDPGLSLRSIVSEDFRAVGQHADERVRLAREVKSSAIGPDDEGARRRYSQREIAAVTGVSAASVSRLFTDRADELGVAAEEASAAQRGGRVKRYSVHQYLRAVELLSKDRVPHSGRAVTVVFANYKGGCAKSTTTATFAARQALKGQRVLAIDMDPQGTLSALFGMQPSLDIGTEDTLLPYFEGEQAGLEYAIKPTRLPTLDVIPSASSLSHADVTIPTRAMEGGYRVKYFEVLDDALARLRPNYDLILIDSPPSLSYLTTLSCYAADGMVIPLQPSLPDYASSATFFEQMGVFFGQLDRVLKTPKAYSFVRMLLTRHDGSRPHRDMEQEIRNTYGGLVMAPTMMESNAVKEASNNHLTIYELDPAFVHRDTLTRALDASDNVGMVLADLVSRVAEAHAAPAMA